MSLCTAAAGHDAVQKVTLIPRGQARGLTWFIPGEDPTLISKQQIFARIVGALGGRATEQVVFGDAEVTTGASSDLQQVGLACLAYCRLACDNTVACSAAIMACCIALLCVWLRHCCQTVETLVWLALQPSATASVTHVHAEVLLSSSDARRHKCGLLQITFTDLVQEAFMSDYSCVLYRSRQWQDRWW